MPAVAPPSAIWGAILAGGVAAFAVDRPIVQDANFRYDPNYVSYVDSQIRGLQTHVVQSLVSGLNATWVTLDASSAAVATGDVVCLAGFTAGTVTRAVSSPLTAAGMAFGIALQACPPGGMVPVAFKGKLPPQITGLPTSGNQLYARVSSSARVQSVASLGTSDFVLGSIDASGNLTLSIQLPAASTGTSLSPGTAGQILFTNTTPAVAWTTVTGDISSSVSSIGQLSVVGFYNRPLNSAAPLVGQAYAWDGSQWTPTTITGGGGGGGGFTPGSDLLGNGTSTSTNQFVSSLSYSSNPAGGGIAVNGTNTALNWVTNAITLQQGATTLVQLKATSTDFIAMGASPGTTGQLRTSSVAASTTSILAVSNQSMLTVLSSGEVRFGPLGVGGTTGIDVSLTAQAGTGSGNGGNLFLYSGTGATGGTTGSVFITVGNNPSSFGRIAFVGAATSGNPGNLGTMAWSAGMAPQLTQNATTTPTCADFVIAPQTSGASPNMSPGNLIVNLSAPAGTGTHPSLQVREAGSPMMLAGAGFGAIAGLGAIWLNQPTTVAQNYTLAGSSAGTVINAPSGTPLSFAINGTTQAKFVSNVLEWADQTLCAIFGGGVLGSDVIPNDIHLYAQDAYSSASTNKTGGTVAINGGLGASGGGVSGNVLLKSGGTTLFQIAGITATQRFVTMGIGSVTGTNLPSGTGDGNVFILEAQTAPTTGVPVGGVLIWCEGGKLKARTPSGTTTTLAA